MFRRFVLLHEKRNAIIHFKDTFYVSLHRNWVATVWCEPFLLTIEVKEMKDTDTIDQHRWATTATRWIIEADHFKNNGTKNNARTTHASATNKNVFYQFWHIFQTGVFCTPRVCPCHINLWQECWSKMLHCSTKPREFDQYFMRRRSQCELSEGKDWPARSKDTGYCGKEWWTNEWKNESFGKNLSAPRHWMLIQNVRWVPGLILDHPNAFNNNNLLSSSIQTGLSLTVLRSPNSEYVNTR